MLGEDLVIKEIRNVCVKFVLFIEDVLFNIVKKVIDKCNYYKVFYKKVESCVVFGCFIGKEVCVVVVVID